jgi:thiamine pyrophosphate-dependent acetolactate synthase large subunit-like protein
MSGIPTVASVIAGDLARYGARRCFGLLGTANFKISHALVEAGVELISARHECNAASMGDAYAKATGELTLVSVHSGPGLTNALTGIGEAAKSRTPLVVLAGDVPSGAVRNNFYIEQADMVRAVGAVPERLHTPSSARDDALRAATRALRDRQTVVLSLPLDVQHASLASNLPPLDLPPAAGRLYPDPCSIERLADALLHAQRPLIVGGRGAVLSDAENALIALAERTGALLATSVCGHGLFPGNPWSLGICGGFSSPIADELIGESDCILAFGASMTQWTTKRGKLVAPGAVVAQVDVEAARLGYQMPIEIAVLGDAKATAETLLAEFDRRGMAARPGRRSAAMRERIRAGDNHHYPHPDESSRDFIDPRTLSKAVDAILPADRVVASDSGHFCGWVPRYLRVPNPRASCLSHSFQSVGLGLPSAIGLAIANPGKLAVLGTGDGGFLMSMADLETAVRLKLRLCILVYNDASYAAEVHYFRRQGYSVDIVQFPDTDFAAIARGYGARGLTVRTLGDLDEVKAWVHEGTPGVFVIDGKINPKLEADWHAEHFPN